MHGLIFVTWEKYLSERFGGTLLNEYRAAIGETVATAPLTSRVYDDATLLAGVGAACKLTGFPAEVILREYGRYFIINGLTSHLCAYLLSQVQSGRDLLLTMRHAHAQMRRTPDSLTPPLFSYEILSANQNSFVLIYDSQRMLCPLLLGAIEGAAERYNEQVQITERACMKRGAPTCRFEVLFSPNKNSRALLSPAQKARQEVQQQFANLVLATLPDREGVTLMELQQIMLSRHPHVNARQVRFRTLFEALHHLQHAGLVSSNTNQTNQAGDDLIQRLYWRTPLIKGDV